MSTRRESAAKRDAVAASLLRTLEGIEKPLDQAKGEADQARKDLSRAEDRIASLVGLQIRVKAELDRIAMAWETCRGLRNELVELGGDLDAPVDGSQPTDAEDREPVEITGARSIALMRILASDTDRIWTAQEVAQEYGLGDDLAHGARIARAGLDYLLKKNVLTKTHRVQGGVERTSYRITAPWTEACRRGSRRTGPAAGETADWPRGAPMREPGSPTPSRRGRRPGRRSRATRDGRATAAV